MQPASRGASSCYKYSLINEWSSKVKMPSSIDNPGNRITIKPEDLKNDEDSRVRSSVESGGAADRIRIDHADIMRAGAACSGVQSSDSSSREEIILLKVLCTFIPFINSFIWFRIGQKRKPRAAVPYLLSGLLLAASLALTAGGIYWGFVERDWVHLALRRAERGVVQIRVANSLGTGVVIASRGDRHLVLTCRHVIKTPETAGGFAALPVNLGVFGYRVASKSGADVQAILVAAPKDEGVDLALLLVQTPDLSPQGPIGRFNEVKQGDEVIAIGHPAGLEFSVTKGAVSAKRLDFLLQTDAAINPGNSGGPLIDSRGQVIGINSFILRGGQAADSQFEGLGFAMRADYLLDFSKWDFDQNIMDILQTLR